MTAGANQAFTNVVLTLLDSQDKVVLFKPYYFNHLMAVQMTGGADNVVYGRYTKLLSHHSHLPGHAFAMSFTSTLIHAFAMSFTSMLIRAFAMSVTSVQNLMSQITCDEACTRAPTNSVTIQSWRISRISLLSIDY